MIQGNDQVSVNFWKEQCQSLFDICKNLKDDNEKLVENLGSLSETAVMGMVAWDTKMELVVSILWTNSKTIEIY